MNKTSPKKAKGIGIDMVSVARFRKIKKTDYKHWSRVFRQEEWAHAFRDEHSSEHLAGIFAAKEAAMKAFGTTGAGHFFDFEVSRTASGAPILNRKALVSISHDGRYAIAVVLAL